MAIPTVPDKPSVLHLGDPVKHNAAIYEQFKSQFTLIRPSEKERGREEFISALKQKRWGEFKAIFRPRWNTGGEMGRWESELISLLPQSVEVYASAGAGYDWVDTDILAENGNTDQFLDAHHNATVTAHDPRDHVLGIIGLGNISYLIAQKAYAAFGMKIYYNDIMRKSAILSISNSFHSDRTKERWLHILWPQVFCSIGFIISAVTLNTAARYTATFMMMSVYGSFGCILSWVATSLPRPSSKREVSYAVVNAGSNFGSIYGSYFYPATQGPAHWQANTANIAFSCLCIILATTLRFYLGWRNKKLEEAAQEDLREGTTTGSRAMALAHKWQCDPEYRYTL